MPTYRMIVAYDGTIYSGWQKQPELLSIEAILEKVFFQVFKTTVHVLGASRTDAGVHAVGQVVRLRASLVIDPIRLRFALNNSLPEDIVVRQVHTVLDSYSPHARVAAKTYYYHIFIKRPLPFIARYGWYYVQPFSVDRFKEALQIFVGSHNFSSFCSVEDTRLDKMRIIKSMQVIFLPHFSAYRVVITGEKFLRHMIRRIIGAAITVAAENSSYTMEDLKRILYNKNPHHPLPNAPSKGLMLYRIMYHRDCNV